MRLRNLFFLGVLITFGPTLATAQEPRTAAPLLVRVHSLNEAKADLGYFAAMIGHDEIKALINFIPVPVVDAAKPLGLYAHVGVKPADCAMVGMLAIVSESEFIAILSRFKIKLTKLDSGIHAFADMRNPLHKIGRAHV